MANIITAYARASRRLLLLDYDGTLVEFNKNPLAAVPDAALLRSLSALADDPANTVVIISGRPSNTLEAWLGHLRVGFSAEHGFMVRNPGATWQTAANPNDSWKAGIRDIMERCTRQLEGSILEEKHNALAWHWRAAPNQTLANQLQEKIYAELKQQAGALHLTVLHILRGNKVIEVHPDGFNKGTATRHWLAQGTYDFVLAAGDDVTDEDTFGALPSGSIAIKIGPGDTIAALRLPDTAALRRLLEACIRAD